jgi:hypothetical protein
MITGQQGLRAIEKALAEIERDEQAARAEAQREAEDHAAFEADLLKGYKDLARARVDIALEDGVIDRADGLSAAVGRNLERWLEAQAALKRRWTKLRGETEAWRKTRRDAHEAVESARSEYDRAFARAGEKLKLDEAHQTLAREYEESLKHIANATSKAATSEAEKAEKGKPYLSDPLFVYLWRRGYGTADYQGFGLTRMLDGWVARLVDYRNARANYAALNEIPARLRQYVERLQASSQAAREAIEANIHRRVSEAAGRDIAAEIARLENQLAEAEKAVIDREAELDRVSDEMTRMAAGDEENFAAALDDLARMLSATPLSDLTRDARTTTSGKDDQAIARIAAIGDKAARSGQRIQGVRERLETLSARRSDLLRIAAEYRRQRYDDRSSEFDQENLFSQLLAQLVAGTLSAGDYWSEVKRRQRWNRRASDRFPRYGDDVQSRRGGAPGWPRLPGPIIITGGGGGGGFGGGSRGGGFRTGGGAGGGGFRTGGSF